MRKPPSGPTGLMGYKCNHFIIRHLREEVSKSGEFAGWVQSAGEEGDSTSKL